MVVEGEIDAAVFQLPVENSSAKILIVDVRPADEFHRGHLPGTINIPDQNININVTIEADGTEAIN